MFIVQLKDSLHMAALTSCSRYSAVMEEHSCLYSAHSPDTNTLITATPCNVITSGFGEQTCTHSSDSCVHVHPPMNYFLHTSTSMQSRMVEIWVDNNGWFAGCVVVCCKYILSCTSCS